MVERIGFIGLGIMGKPMARNLMKAGYEVTVYDIVGEAEINKRKRANLVSRTGAFALCIIPSDAQLLVDQFLYQLWIGLAAGLLHHLAQQELDGRQIAGL